jgi:diguanylate cyclase (GGDEF)-like protein
MFERESFRNLSSPYAAELQRGTVSLRFPAALENEFRAVHLDRTRSRVKAWQLALLVLGTLSAITQLFEQDQVRFSLEVFLRWFVLIPTCAALVWSAWSPKFERNYMAVALAGNSIIAVVSSWLIANVIAAGRPESLVFLTTNAFAVFFLTGLLFFDACLVAILAIFSFALAGVVAGLPLETMAYHTAVLGTVVAVGAFTSWGIEETNRRDFLERGVLGDLAERDGLTGLRNRRAFDEHLLRVWQQSLRDRSPVAVMMIDLDYFKNYNDAYGHQAGDACLTQVSQLVQRFARRPLDLAARYGGEELAVVLYQINVEQAQSIAEQLRVSVQNLRIEHRASPIRGGVTISVGLAWVEASFDRTPEALVQLADEALYSAKLAGRNQVKFLGPEHKREFTSTLKRLPTPKNWVGD